MTDSKTQLWRYSVERTLPARHSMDYGMHWAFHSDLLAESDVEAQEKVRALSVGSNGTLYRLMLTDDGKQLRKTPA